MQNPLRRPKAGGPSHNNRDVERNHHKEDGVLDKGVRGHLVAMSGEFVGTVMFLYFAFAATRKCRTLFNIASFSSTSLQRGVCLHPFCDGSGRGFDGLTIKLLNTEPI